MRPILGRMGITINTCPLISGGQVYYISDNLILNFQHKHIFNSIKSKIQTPYY